MINKIKDKQTGEYHDIGGLKCKLVAEGTLEWNEENETYNKLYDFENGKFYLIVLLDNYIDEIVKFQGVMLNDRLTTAYYRENIGDKLVWFDYALDSDEYSILDNNQNCVNLGNNVKCKIYELPFALEV